MYIYHFWPLCMHCKKTTTIRCFLEATYDLLVVLRKPWICTLCFDAHFSKFRDFWWFWTIFNRKMDILDHFWGPPTASSPKVTIYLPLTPRTLSGPAQNPVILTYFASFWTPFEGPGGRLRLGPVQAAFGLEDLLRASQTHARNLKFWLFLTTFPIEKVNFCHFAYQGSVKMPFWPYFDPILSPPEPKPLAPGQNVPI